MRITELYDNAEYSDLTIRLSDGSDIRVHKVIICTKNTVLRRLCQNNLSILELSNDDALAVEFLIRHLYGHKLDRWNGSWGFWLDVRTVAKKYGQKSLRSIASAKASRLLIKLFENEEDGELLRFLAVIEQYHADDERLSRMVKRLRQEPEFH